MRELRLLNGLVPLGESTLVHGVEGGFHLLLGLTASVSISTRGVSGGYRLLGTELQSKSPSKLLLIEGFQVHCECGYVNEWYCS